MIVVVLSILILHYNMYYLVLAKTQVSLTRFLQSEVKIIHIIVQNNKYYYDYLKF
jgi:hypothetical protein